eukprot:7313747-Prymnesium_polylepis.1
MCIRDSSPLSPSPTGAHAAPVHLPPLSLPRPQAHTQHQSTSVVDDWDYVAGNSSKRLASGSGVGSAHSSPRLLSIESRA